MKPIKRLAASKILMTAMVAGGTLPLSAQPGGPPGGSIDDIDMYAYEQLQPPVVVVPPVMVPPVVAAPTVVPAHVYQAMARSHTLTASSYLYGAGLMITRSSITNSETILNIMRGYYRHAIQQHQFAAYYYRLAGNNTAAENSLRIVQDLDDVCQDLSAAE